MIPRAFCPQFEGISASTCKRDVMKLFGKEKSDLLKTFDSFEGKICLTSDCWSSRQQNGLFDHLLPILLIRTGI